MPAVTVIALTGDVGAGKSTVSKIFAELGGKILSADQIVADLWRREDIVKVAVERWGDDILDAGHRAVHAEIARRTFSNINEYRWLCNLLHPMVFAAMKRTIDQLDPSKDWAVAEVPLLFETGVPSWVSASVYVTAPRPIRLSRCAERGWDQAELDRRESFYAPAEKRMAMSNYVIQNDDGLERLKNDVQDIYLRIISQRSSK